jgi:predicted enzyme related to lactoylglutathione lyase
MFKTLESIVFFVTNIHTAAQWYATLFNTTVQYENPQYAFIHVQGLILGFHPEDAKNQHGMTSSVVYWEVDDFDNNLQNLLKLGCLIYRNPMTTSLGAKVAMLIDPFGNHFGINQSAVLTK